MTMTEGICYAVTALVVSVFCAVFIEVGKWLWTDEE
jgi:hypothetical protein